MVEQQPMTSVGGCFLRVFWILLGPSVMAVIGLTMIMNRVPMGSPLDIAFLGATVLVIAARFLDASHGRASGSGPVGRPWLFAVWTMIFGGAVFVAAHVVAPALFPSVA